MFMQLQPVSTSKAMARVARRALDVLLDAERSSLVLVLGLLILITLSGVGLTV
jgi:hypothetical protein